MAGAVLLYEGSHQRYPWRPWLLLIAGTWLLFMLGSRWIADAWPTQPTIGRLSAEARAILGGLAGGGLGLALMRRVLGFDRRAADAFALPFALGLGVQGAGSIVAGMNLHTASMPHVVGATAGVWQLARGLWLGAEARPLPAAQVALCGLIVLGLILIRHRRVWLLVPGNAWLLALALFMAGRFGLEFWQVPTAAALVPGTWLGLKLVQWVLAGAALSLTAAATWRARAWTRGVRPYAFPTDRPLPNLLLFAGVLGITLSPVNHWLNAADLLVMRGLLLPVLLLEGWRLACVTGLVKPHALGH